MGQWDLFAKATTNVPNKSNKSKSFVYTEKHIQTIYFVASET